MKMKEEAVKYFRGAEKYNCAQAIIKTFCSGCSNEDIDKFKNAGHGQAEEGLCGIIYASKQLLFDKQAVQLLEKKFYELAGSIKYRDILKLKKLTCTECVKLAAEFMEENVDKVKLPKIL